MKTIYQVLESLLKNNKISQSLYKSQLNYLQCGGCVFYEVRKHYKIDKEKEIYILN